MSSSAAGPNAIRLPVVVEIDQATLALKSFRRVAETESAGAARSIQTNFTDAEKKATTFKEAVRGAGPAITGLSAAMGQAAGPMGAFSRSILSIASNGFTPLGIAIGIVTAATALWIGKSREAAEQSREAAKAHADEAQAVRDLATEEKRRFDQAIAGARSAGIVKTTGVAPDVAAAMEAVADAQRRIAEADYSVLGMERLRIAERDLAVAEKRLLVEKHLAALAGRPFLPESSADPNAQILGEPSTGRTTRIQTQDEADAIKAREEFFGATDDRTGRWDWYNQAPERNARNWASLTSDAEQDLLTAQGMRRSTLARAPFSIGFTPSVLPPTAAEKYAKGFGDAFTSGVTDAAVDLANSGDIGGFFRSIADQAQQAIYNGIISGFIEGTGLRSAAASVGQQLFGAGASALTAGAGGGDTSANGPMVSDAFFAPKSAKAGGGDTIVIALVPDEAAADTMLSKASHRGAKAIAARMDGRGVAAGSIPTRRRG